MSDNPKPTRYLGTDELSVEQIVATDEARRSGRPIPKFERPEWREAADEALADAGLLDDAQDGDLEALSAEDHAEHLRASW